MARLSEIVLQGGAQRAETIRRNAAIEAERRSRSSANTAQAISSIGATFADAVNPATKARLDAMKQDAEMRGLQIQGAKDERAAAETAKQRQQAISQVMGAALEGDPATGHVTYNRQKLAEGFASLGMADQFPAYQKALDEADSAALKYQESLRDALAGVAYGVHLAGNDPTVFENEVKRAIANRYITAEDAKPYLDAAAKDQAAIQRITSALASSSPKFAELLKKDAPEFVSVSPGGGVMNKQTGVVTPGLPKPPDVPTEFEREKQAEVIRHNQAMEAIGAKNAQANVQRSGAAAQAASGGGGGVSTSKLSSQAQSVLARVTTGVPSTRVSDIKREATRLAAEGNEAGLKSYLRYAAIETLGEARKTAMVGRMETIQALSDAEELLKSVPTGLIAGTWEDTMRKLGQTSDPRLVELGTRMGSVLANYMRSISGAAIADKEAERLTKLLPNYGNNLPVNLGTMKGFAAAIKSFDDAFYKHKFGENMDWVLGGGAPKSTAPGGKLSAEDLIKKYGGG